jgi:hypothetical protein
MRKLAFLFGGLMLASPLSAATIMGEFWDASASLSDLADADAVIAAGPATATFDVSALDYPSGPDSVVVDTTTLSSCLGSDAGSLDPASAGALDMTYSVFRFTGMLDLLPGDQEFSVGSDDGFRLTIDGSVVSDLDGLRPYATTVVDADPGTGLVPFVLVYFENEGVTGVEFAIDGTIVAPFNTAVPIPAPLPFLLMTTALAALLVTRRN